ncbi:tautomerase family protein [Actinomycetes bacterium M1A6_2h]
MPVALVEVRRSYTAAEEVGLMDAVHNALVVAFAIPAGDKHIRLIEHRPHRMTTSPGLTHPDRYTLITIDCFSGRSIDAKRTLYKEIVSELAQFHIPADHITITLRESALENWGISGGQAASDIDLGFAVDV